jgi:PAS domain S-box-containing protein
MDHEEPPTTGAAAADTPLDERVSWIRARELSVARRARALAEREELLQLREMALEAVRHTGDASARQGHLLGQVREANERLVTAIVEAQELAEQADAARRAADHNEERFRSLVYTSSALVWQAAADGRIEIARDAWRRFTGIELGQGDWGWLDAVHPSDQDRVRDAWTAAVATGSPYACQYRIQSHDGGFAWVMARAVPLANTGALREWVGMITDVSDRVRVEQAREQFIGILGHDLRNPLSAILMGVEMLAELPEPYSGVVARVGRSAHRIEAMIRDLLDFARGRLAGAIPVTPRPCDLRVVCDQIVEEMKQAHPDRVISFDARGDLRGEWDPDRIEQAVSNLVGNAITHGTGPVRVSSCDEGGEIVTTVHNQGRPVAAAAIPTRRKPMARRRRAWGSGSTSRARSSARTAA